ncbi:hypothetical protein [Streptomyces parvulus]|uniref:hypothetical protein n=1 Tax=Streptomyces parvulus TaxID=146923 RepID=UPI0036C51459
MKIQERTGAGAGRSAAPAQPSVGDRLPSPPRERKPALAALAVLLILLGALGATMLVLRVGDRVEAIEITADIKPGESINKDNIKVVMVNDDSGANFVPWEQRAGLMELQAKSRLYKGTVVVGEMFAEKADMEQGKATVGVSLKQGQYPSGLDAGDNVAVYRVGSKAGGSTDQGAGASGSAGTDNSLLVERAVVESAPAAGGDGLTGTSQAATLTVDADDASAVAQAASAGEVAVVLIPGN